MSRGVEKCHELCLLDPVSGMTVYVACTPHLVTGGPELLHQFVHCLRAQGVQAKLFFAGVASNGPSPIPAEYAAYENPFVTEFKPQPKDLLVVPETLTSLLNDYKSVHRAIWWLSVDNYHQIIDLNNALSPARRLLREVRWRLRRERRPFVPAYDKDLPIFHFYQSEYARQFLLSNGISEEKMLPLSDYLNESFLSYDFLNEADREDVILYNPRKGMEVTQRLMKAAPDLKFEPLIGLTRDQMVERLKRCKLYIDFGHHPGKDRIPREACALGCGVLTNRRGSAANSLDVPIPAEFKIDDTTVDPNTIASTIRAVLVDFHAQRDRLNGYRASIVAEPAKFAQQVQYLVEHLELAAGQSSLQEV